MIIKRYIKFLEDLNEPTDTVVTNPNDPNGILKDTIKKIAVDGSKSIKDKISAATKIKGDLERIFTSTDAKGNLAQKDEDVKKNLDEILKKNPGNEILKDLINSLSLKRELKQLELKKKGTEDRIDTLKAREIENPTDDIKKTKSEAEKDLSEITKDIANISIRITDAETNFNKNKKEMDQKLKNSEQKSKL
jgi:hypothetical protein